MHCDGGYTTNVPAEDLIDGKAMVASHCDGEPLDPEHGGPARLSGAASLFLEEREMGAPPQFIDT